MLDLSTTYLGLRLRNPIIPSSSPLMKSLDNIKRLEDAGAAAVVLHSLFEEQLIRERDTLDYFLAYGTESFSEAPTFFPNLSNYNFGPQGYLEHIRKIKEAVKIPVIASLNGFSPGGWIEIAQQIEQAGADAIELNMYYIAADYEQDSLQVEETYRNLLREIKASVKIPIAVKLGQHFTAFANFARQLDQEGVRGLVLFNRFYQPDIDLENLNIVPDLELSTPYELRLRLRWIAILYGSLECDLAVTGGVHSAEDAIKCIMTGASSAMMTSALLLNGISHLKKVLTDLKEWMEKHEYESIKQMRGSMSQKSVSQPSAYERANYMRVLQSYSPNGVSA